MDTSSPTAVIGTGSAASCTESALRAAVAQGGVITFNCGSNVATIRITQPLVAPNDRHTTIDGNYKIVLDGGGTTQILRASHDDFRNNDTTLTVQRLAMINGNDVGMNFQARNGDSTCAWGYHTGGGGAIGTKDVNVNVWGVTFENNKGPAIGPDVAGGAIYVMNAKRLRVANSSFLNNSASNGGAIGVLHTQTDMYNVVMENNRATGLLANAVQAGCPMFNHDEQGGAGGLGGSFYSDGFDPGDYLCGVRIANSTATNLGGGIFRSAYWQWGDGPIQTITWKQCTFDNNHTDTNGGGAAYVNNSRFTVEDTSFYGNSVTSGDGGGLKITGASVFFKRVSFINNSATIGGGLTHWSPGGDGVEGTAEDVTFSGNTPTDWNGAAFPMH